MPTTIQIDVSVKKKLDKLKQHQRDTYNEVLKALLHGEQEENLRETIDVLSDPQAMREIAAALETIGKGIDFDQLRKELHV